MSVGGALTPVALRAPSVSAPPKTGTFYFAQNRNFLLCLDRALTGPVVAGPVLLSRLVVLAPIRFDGVKMGR